MQCNQENARKGFMKTEALGPRLKPLNVEAACAEVPLGPWGGGSSVPLPHPCLLPPVGPHPALS